MLEGLFGAQRVAVVGVSASAGNVGRNIIKNMIDLHYTGEIFAVGRSGGELNGKPIYRTVDDIPGEIELGIIMVPAQYVAEALDACGRKGAPWAVIPSSGFGEFADDRKDLEAELLTVARKHGMRFVGPNCLGIINFITGLSTPFAPVSFSRLHRGPVSVLSQSGASAQILSGMLSEFGPGVNKFISIGNKLDLDEVDYLSYLAEDPSTEVICVYLEDIRRGRALMEAARRCQKPVLVHKGGITTAGARVARSHTAALAVDDAIADAAFRQAGLVRLQGLRKMAIASGVVRLPKMKGNRLAVVSASGGSSVILGDLCEQHGFVLPVIEQGVLDSIQESGRAGVIRLTNPVDMGDIWNMENFAKALLTIASLGYIDGVIVVLPISNNANNPMGNTGDKVVSRMKEIGTQTAKPIVASSMGANIGTTEMMHDLDFPIIVDPEDTVEAIEALYRYSMRH